MSEEKKFNREWVKTAAIIFLIILLILTFFSNTIMNRTLPEVATTAITSGAITAKVRATGTVTAVGNNEVKAESTRYIASVMVKAGQTVNAGDVLFVMGEGESEELEAAQEEYDSLQYQLMRAQNSYPTSSNSANLAVNSALQSYYEALSDYNVALNNFNNSATSEQIASAKKAMEQALVELTSAQNEADIIKTMALSDYDDKVEAATITYNAEMAAATTEAERTAAQATYDNAVKNARTTYESTISTSQNNIINKQLEYDSLCDVYENLAASTSSELYTKLQTAESKLRSAESSYYAALDSANSSNDTYNKSSTSAYIDVLEIENKIEKAKEKIAKLSGDSENNITAKVSGTVTTINKTAGDKVQKDDILCIIEVPDMGYMMSCSVTNDQAKRLKIGDTGTISNYYWGSDVVATVSAIKTDTKDPQTKKLIEFDLQGDVTSGAELTVSVGQKSANYDYIVPNNAVRSDSNGSFVLVVNSKNSALGNRYFAQRVDVTVLASDDNNSAISGNLSSGSFVITTSSSPVSNGSQVRMADS